MWNKILYFWERIYPHVISFIVTTILFGISFNPVASNGIDDLVNGIVTLDSIIIGFMGAIIPVILSMKNESKLVQYVFDRDKDGLFRKYISETIIYGLFDVCVSLIIYIRDLIVNEKVFNAITYLFIYSFVLFITSTYRGMSCMLRLIFSDDTEIEENISNKLTEKEKENLWNKRGK